jgi:hypothetical protein
MARGSLGAAKGLVAGPSRLMSAWPINSRGFLRPMASMGLDGCSHAGGSSSSAEFRRFYEGRFGGRSQYS